MVNQYVLKVYPLGLGREVYRTLEICGESTLDQLCETILAAFDFFHEHLYEFCMDNKMFSESFNRFLIISLDVLICRYSPSFRAFPALFISEEPHKSFYYPSCFRSQK